MKIIRAAKKREPTKRSALLHVVRGDAVDRMDLQRALSLVPRIVHIGLQILHRRKFGDEHGVVIVLPTQRFTSQRLSWGMTPEKPTQSGEELLLLTLRSLAELP